MLIGFLGFQPVNCVMHGPCDARPVVTFKILLRKDSSRHRHRSTSCVQNANFIKFGRPEKLASMLRLRGSRPTSAMASGKQCTQISGPVIAECVNTVETRDTVNPILGEAIAYRAVTKFRLALGAARIAPKMCQSSGRQCTQSAPKFHSNLFTFG